jgi:hypothetical protein
MIGKMSLFRVAIGGLALSFALVPGAAGAPFDVVEKLLVEKCAKCHGAGSKQSNFDVGTRESVLKGGRNGAAVVPGDAANSRLYQWIAQGKMPPGEALDATTVRAVREWIDSGATWGQKASILSKKYWAFQPPLRREPPPSDEHPIDAFLLEKLREKKLDFSGKADHRTLIRRLYFDLTGLPPTADDYRQTYSQAVDRLLASPAYGERWARHWLDVVRFGETDGGEHNFERMNAWPYRDWVIESLNADKPYDRFIREQIAGDLLAPSDPKMVAATGFLVAGPWDSVSAVLNKDEALRQQARMDELDDMVTTTAHSFLALTVNCARCHDHKFDPIPTRDYYRMTAFFSAVTYGEREVASEEERKARDEFAKPLRAQSDAAKKKLAAIEDPVRARLLLARYQTFDREHAADPRRMAVNPIFNRNQFPGITAKHFRFIVLNQQGRAKPKLEYLELQPARHRVTNWEGTAPASADKPQTLQIDLPVPQAISQIEFASDSQRGLRDGAVSVYRFEASDDGVAWREAASSLGHVGAMEVSLPELGSDDLSGALTAEAREQRRKLLDEINEVQRRLEAGPSVLKLHAAKPKELEKAYVLERGNVKQPGEEVQPGILSAVGGEFMTSTDAAARRIALANWIASDKNALTARVIVNRVWYLHFGNGIVNTPSDFGINGDRPSHPELLDWLAVSFVENGWSLKWLHRQILQTRAYQQSGAMNDQAFAVDAGNRLLWRMPMKRMDAETLRDTTLAVTGNLNAKMGGPSFMLQKKGGGGSYIYAALDNDGPDVWRRAVYRFVVRGGERIMMDSFDCPDPSVATPQRAVSNTPVQALTLMNNEFLIRQAGLLASRLEKDAPDGRKAQIQRAYQLLYGRTATARELERDSKFIAAQSLPLYCRALLNSNEFLYVP